MSDRATIRDVARLAGYSITTVSLVMNNKEANIPQSTREKVWRAASALNYRPNKLAVSMVTKHTNVLGLIVPDNSNMFYAQAAKEVERSAKEMGYSVIYGNTDNDPQQDYNYLRMFIDHQVDGIVYVRSSCQHLPGGSPAVEALQQASIPVVALGREIQGQNLCSVLQNDFRSGFLATSHLLSLGHRRIACMTGQPDLSSSNARMEGYRAAMNEAGVPYEEGLVFEGDFTPTQASRALEQFLGQGATAIFSFNDHMAIGLYRAIRSKGLRVPKDISVVGCDGIPILDLVDPPMTTVQCRLTHMAGCAVDVLVQMIRGSTPEKRVYVYEPELVVRSSTAPLQAGRGRF